MASHCIHFAGQNSHCQSMTWPIMTMTRLRLIFPCIMCGKIISAQGLVINHLKNIHVVLVLACMLCGNTLWCLSPTIEHITSVHVLPFQPSGRKLNLRLRHDNIYCSSPQPCLFDDLTVIDPMNRQHMGIQDQKDKWNILWGSSSTTSSPRTSWLGCWLWSCPASSSSRNVVLERGSADTYVKLKHGQCNEGRFKHVVVIYWGCDKHYTGCLNNMELLQRQSR